MTFPSSPMRRHVLGAAAAAVLALSSFGAAAQGSFPDKPLTFVVPFPPGGTTDIVARVVAEAVSGELKRPVIVENRAGAGGNVGADYVAKSKADGYTLLVSTAGPLAINHHLYAKQSFDPARDFAPVALLGMVPIMMVTGMNQPYKSVAELVAAAKANPGKLSYGSQGNGTTSHLTMELLKSQAGIDMVHVPYRGSAPAATDLIGGQINVMFDNSPSTLPFVQGNRMRALGVASAKRVPAMKDIPAVSETLAGFESTAWFALVAPAGTPAEVVRVLNTAVNGALKNADVRKKFEASGAELAGGSTDDLARFMRDESAKWGRVVKSASVKLD